MATKTVVMGLRNQLLRPPDLDKITKLVDEVSEIRFHAKHLLAIYATIVAAQGEAVGEVFNQTLIDQAIAKVRFPNKLNGRAPENLNQAERIYFSGPLLNVRQTRPTSDLNHIDIVKQLRVQLEVEISNCLQLTTPSNQRMAMRQLYQLSSKEAKLLCSVLSTSAEKRLEVALDAHVKRYKRIALRKRDELDVAIRNELPTAELEAQLRKLEADVEARKAEAMRHPELSLDSLLTEHAFKPRVRQAGMVGPQIELDEILRRELLLLPATQSQADQLNYRFALLGRLDAEACESRFNLLPSTKFGRAFVYLTKDPFANLAPIIGGGRKRKPEYNDMNDLIPLVFNMANLDRLTKGGELCFGDSVRTDGIQLQLLVVDAENRESKRRKEEAKKEGKERKKEAEAKGEVYVKPKPKKKTLSTKLPKRKEEQKVVLPEGAICVAADTGIRNIGGFVSEESIDQPYIISTGEYYHASGIKRRQRELAAAEELQKSVSAAFQLATVEVASARTKTSILADLVGALQTRGAHFRTMYAFYGAEGIARHRFQNYQGKQKTLEKLVKRVLPTRAHVLICGDADFGSVRQGLPAGVAGKFVKKCMETRTVIFADEFRSSMLDSNTHAVMHHPPKEMAVSKFGKPYLRRVYGLYQSSASGYSHLWNRDCNAARNILLNFRYKYEHGTVPGPFLRGALLPMPKACYYKYAAKAGGGFKRLWRDAADPAGPLSGGAMYQPVGFRTGEA